MKVEWENIFEFKHPEKSINRITARVKVIGGWMVTDYISRDNFSSQSSVFVPDANYSWDIMVNPVLNKSIDELELRMRTYNCLMTENIKTIGDLVNKTRYDLLRMVNFGPTSLMDVRTELLKHGLSLRECKSDKD